jgi:hypothetical protein
MKLASGTAPDSLLGGSPAVTISARRSTCLIAAPTVRSMATYALTFALPHQ